MGLRYSPIDVCCLMLASNSGLNFKNIAIKKANGTTPMKEVNIPTTTPEVISEVPAWCSRDQARKAIQSKPKWITPLNMRR